MFTHLDTLAAWWIRRRTAQAIAALGPIDPNRADMDATLEFIKRLTDIMPTLRVNVSSSEFATGVFQYVYEMFRNIMLQNGHQPVVRGSLEGAAYSLLALTGVDPRLAGAIPPGTKVH